MIVPFLMIVFALVVVIVGGHNDDVAVLYYDVDFTELYESSKGNKSKKESDDEEESDKSADQLAVYLDSEGTETSSDQHPPRRRPARKKTKVDWSTAFGDTGSSDEDSDEDSSAGGPGSLPESVDLSDYEFDSIASDIYDNIDL